MKTATAAAATHAASPNADHWSGHAIGRSKRLTGHPAELYATGAPVVLAGDFNVVPTGIDIYPTKSWDRDVLLQPQSRAACSPGKRGTQLCRDHTEPVAQSRLT